MIRFRYSNSLPDWKKHSALYLYNEADHLRLQSNTDWHLFECIDPNGAILARIAFHISAQVASSPLRSPFGSIELFKNLSQAQLKEFMGVVYWQLQDLDVKEIKIRSFPDLYAETYSKRISTALVALGFQKTIEVDSIIKVSRTSFEKIIKPSERQKLRKSAAEFQFRQAESNRLKVIYAFIKKCRDERDQLLSMKLSELEKLVATFPKQIYFFEAGSKELAAVSIVIRVSDKILYTFYYAHNSKFNRISPVVFLMEGIYKFAQREKVKIIDLGTSMLDGKINQPLLHFKKSIGGSSNNKVTFSKLVE